MPRAKRRASSRSARSIRAIPQNLTAHLFAQKTGIDAAIVPYKAVPDLITALIRGDINLGVDYFAGFQPVANDTRIRFSLPPARSAAYSCRTCQRVEESGYPDFVVSSWQGLAAPRGVPGPGSSECSNGEMVAAAADPEFRKRLLQTGQTPGGSSIKERRMPACRPRSTNGPT